MRFVAEHHPEGSVVLDAETRESVFRSVNGTPCTTRDVAHVLAVALNADRRHLMTFNATGFAIQHPLTCPDRPNLLNCPYNAAGEAMTGPPLDGPGLYEADLLDGTLTLTRIGDTA